MIRHSIRNTTVAAIFCLLSAPISHADVSMPSSPVQGNPVDLAVNWSTTGTTQVTLVIDAVPGQIQGSCYIEVAKIAYGLTVRVY